MTEKTHRNYNRRGLFSYLRFFNFSLLFSVLYIIFNWVYVSLYGAIQNSFLIFITSPFSALEDFSTSYGSFWAGFLLNFLPVFVMLAIMSYIYTKNNGLNRFLKPSDVFCTGVASSYLTSAVYWLAFKTPSRGTSIIAITLLIYFLIYAITFDFKGLFSKKAKKKYSERERGGLAYVTRFLFILAIILAFTSMYNFLLLPHAIGLLISFAIIASIILLRENYKFLIRNFRIE